METGRAEVDGVDLAGAWRALRAARYDEVLAATAAWETSGSHIGSFITLRAEALLRRSPADTIAWLAGLRDLITDGDDAALFAYEIASARAYAAVANLEAADARLSAAARVAGAVSGGTEMLALQRARVAFMRRDLAHDHADLTVAVGAADPQVRLEALEVRAWSHALREDYAAQRAGLRSALAHAALHPDHVHARVVANITFILARLSFETADADGSADAAAAYATIEWNDDLRVPRFQTLRAMGWDAYVRGEPGRAQWLFRDAMACAPSRAWETMARLDRAHVARLSRNEAWATEELEIADDLASDVAWSSTVGEERIVLATLSQLLAPMDISRAQRYAATFTALGSRGMDPTLIYSEDKDRRGEAFRRYVNGTLERVAGNTEAATTALRLAYTFFDATNYVFRAALTAADLYELTGDAMWAERARVHASAYPGSPLVARLRVDERRDPVLDLLTPFQRQLARALWEGIDDEERLSHRFSRSIATIRRETPVIFAAFGVASRAALRSAASARGLASA